MPNTYFITFHTYGTWLHGDPRGSVDPAHNVPGTPVLGHDPLRMMRDRRRMLHPAFELDAAGRGMVDRTIRDLCGRRGWELHAINVRTNHVHVVLSSDRQPERVMSDIKAWCTRKLVEAGVLPPNGRAWSRHGSTRWLNDERSFTAACVYVVEQQGADLAMASH